MKSYFKILLALCIFTSINAQDKEKNENSIKVPTYIILNKFTNKDTYKMIRWIKWSDEQKKQLFLYSQEIGKDEKLQQPELSKKMHTYIDTIITEPQKAEFLEKCKNADLLKAEIEKALADFEVKTSELKGLPLDKDLYDVLISTRFFYFPETWAITRTPLNEDERKLITEMLSNLIQVEQGFHLASGKTTEDLNKDYNIFDFNMKKDFGTPMLIETIKKFSKPNQEIFNNLLNHYLGQKKLMHEIYQKYSSKTKFEIPMSPPKVFDENSFKKPEERK